MLDWLVSNESEKMSEEVVVDLISYFTSIYVVGLVKNMKQPE
jgi:hypothetical protein